MCRKEKINRKRNVNDNELRKIVSNKLSTSLVKVGYRQETETITVKYNINVSTKNVRKALKELNPSDVQDRWRKLITRRIYDTNGPADAYHIDGNDKLKRWGFAIHGCIDGFSRKILWLHVSTSNNDLLIITNFYLSCISKYNICPRILRMDRGNENIYCEDLQVFFTRNPESFIYGASIHSQRIESFWARLKKFKISWWIEYFKEMVKSGLYKESKRIKKHYMSKRIKKH